MAGEEVAAGLAGRRAPPPYPPEPAPWAAGSTGLAAGQRCLLPAHKCLSPASLSHCLISHSWVRHCASTQWVSFQKAARVAYKVCNATISQKNEEGTLPQTFYSVTLIHILG